MSFAKNQKSLSTILIVIAVSSLFQPLFSSTQTLDDGTSNISQKISADENLKEQINNLTKKNDELIKQNNALTQKLNNSVSKEYLITSIIMLILIGISLAIAQIIQKKQNSKPKPKKIIASIVEIEINTRIAKNLTFLSLFYSAIISVGVTLMAFGLSLSFGLLQEIFKSSDKEELTPAFQKFIDSAGVFANNMTTLGVIVFMIGIGIGFLVIYGQRLKKNEIDLLTQISENRILNEKPRNDSPEQIKPWGTMPRDWKS